MVENWATYRAVWLLHRRANTQIELRNLVRKAWFLSSVFLDWMSLEQLFLSYSSDRYCILRTLSTFLPYLACHGQGWLISSAFIFSSFPCCCRLLCWVVIGCHLISCTSYIKFLDWRSKMLVAYVTPSTCRQI